MKLPHSTGVPVWLNVSEKTITCNAVTQMCRSEYAAFEDSGIGWRMGAIRYVARGSICATALKDWCSWL